MAEVVILRDLFTDILRRIDRFRPPTGSVRPDRIVGKKPFRATNATTWSTIIWIGAKMVVIRKRMHVERFRVTLNGLGGSHMGNPDSQDYERGVSASIAARQDNAIANQMFKWRRLHLELAAAAGWVA